jgi:ABC-2 type transport system ATP-binding protein
VIRTGGLLRDLTVRETVRLTASVFAQSLPVDEVPERAGITGIADRLVGKCSGGEQQRLRFALALLPDPALMALDEPTAGMDVEGRRGFWSAIRRDAECGRTVLFATHDLEEADAYADRVILLRHGQIGCPPTGSSRSPGTSCSGLVQPDLDPERVRLDGAVRGGGAMLLFRRDTRRV